MASMMQFLVLAAALAAVHAHGGNNAGACESALCPSSQFSIPTPQAELEDSTSLIQSHMRVSMDREMSTPAPQVQASATSGSSQEKAASGNEAKEEDSPGSMAYDMAVYAFNEEAKRASETEGCLGGAEGGNCSSVQLIGNPFSIPKQEEDVTKHASISTLLERIEIERQGQGKLQYLHGVKSEDLHQYVSLMDVKGNMLDVHEIINNSNNETRLSELQYPMFLALSEKQQIVSLNGAIDWEKMFDRQEDQAKLNKEECHAQLDRAQRLYKGDTFYRENVKLARETFKVRAKMLKAQFDAESKRREQLGKYVSKILKQNGGKTTSSGIELTPENQKNSDC